MKRNINNHNIPASSMPDIEIVDLECENMQDTDSGNSQQISAVNSRKTSHRSNVSKKSAEFSEDFEDLDEFAEPEDYEIGRAHV